MYHIIADTLVFSFTFNLLIYFHLNNRLNEVVRKAQNADIGNWDLGPSSASY